MLELKGCITWFMWVTLLDHPVHSLLPEVLYCMYLDVHYAAAKSVSMLHDMDVSRTIFKEQAAENKFFESQEMDVQHAQLASAIFLDPAAPPV